MSARYWWACASHDPTIGVDLDRGSSRIEDMRPLYAGRAEIVEAITVLAKHDFDIWNFDEPERSAVAAFRQHPTCRLVAISETGDVVDLEEETT
jgi:hypothetical protein